MMPKGKPKTKSSAISVDMTGVEAGGLIAEGDYNVRVDKVVHGMSESSGKPKLSWEFVITSDKHNGGRLYYTTSLQPQALFNLKNLLLCLGVSVPNAVMKLDLDDYIDRECGVTVGHEMYDGKKKSRISDIWPLDEASEEDEEEETDDDDGDEDEVDYDELSLADLKALCKERNIKVLKKDDKDSLIEKLEEADEAEDL